MSTTTIGSRLFFWLSGLTLIVALITIGCEVESEQDEAAAEPEEVECEDYRGIIDVGAILECIEKGEFEESSLSRVKVSGYAPSHLFGDTFRISDFDSLDRPINGVITTSHAETYETLLRLGSSDWINLSCYYSSYTMVEEYTEDGNKAYAIVNLNDCIDLR